MKKIYSFLFLFCALTFAVSAQGTFKGIVKYKVESTGDVAFQVPPEAATAEIKVLGENLFTQSAIFLKSPFTECVLVQGYTVSLCDNYGQLLDYLRSNGSEFTYQGKGKILVTNTFTKEQSDSLTVPDTEVGHYYFEYVDGETKEIAGIEAKKVVMHQYDDNGVDQPVEMWYTDEMGPAFNYLFMGIKGMPLMCKQNLGDGRAVTYTATQIVKGKVKDVDFLLPDGYEQLDDDAMRTFATELQEELELMNE